jgi:hypothetical protein
MAIPTLLGNGHTGNLSGTSPFAYSLRLLKPLGGLFGPLFFGTALGVRQFAAFPAHRNCLIKAPSLVLFHIPYKQIETLTPNVKRKVLKENLCWVQNH